MIGIKAGGIKRQYMMHRVIWVLAKGRWPRGEIDHKDRNRSNNRLANLRDSTHTQNMMNACIRSNNKTGFKGVRWHEECKGYAAHIKVGNKRLWLGAHPTPEQASAAYAKAAKKYYGEFARAK